MCVNIERKLILIVGGKLLKPLKNTKATKISILIIIKVSKLMSVTWNKYLL